MTDKILTRKERGIHKISEEMGWVKQKQPVKINGAWEDVWGCAYPVYNLDGQEVGERWKAFDARATKIKKYGWIGEGRPTYYHQKGFGEYLKSKPSELWIAAGEVDVLTLAAVGTQSICWLRGEGAIPDNLITLLTRWGIKRVYYAPDCDYAGCRTGVKLFDLFAESEIELELVALTDIIQEFKGDDLNELWMNAKFDADRFAKGLIERTNREELVAHIPSRPTSPAPPKQPAQIPEPPFAEWFAEWIEDVVSALGTPDKTDGGIDRWHCPIPTHTDNNPSFRVDRSGSNPRPRCSCGIQDADDAWGEIALSLKVESWTDRKSRKAKDWNIDHPQQATQRKQPETNPDQPPIVDTKGATHALSLALTGDFSKFGEPLYWPYPEMWHFGGYAQCMTQRKMWGLIGGTGTGKTTFIERGIRFWLQNGEWIITDKAEWMPPESIMKDIQNLTNGEITYMDLLLHMHVLQREKQKLPVVLPMAKKLTSNKMERINQILQLVNTQYAGQTYVDNEAQGVEYIEQRMEFVADYAATMRRKGFPIRIAVIDYIQALGIKMFAKNEEEAKLRVIKDVASKQKLAVYLVAQVTKTAEARARETGRFLSSQDMNWARGDALNFLVSLNVEYFRTEIHNRKGEIAGTKLALDDQGEPVPTGKLLVACTKNSMGKLPQWVKYRRTESGLDFEAEDWMTKERQDDTA